VRFARWILHYGKGGVKPSITEIADLYVVTEHQATIRLAGLGFI